MELEPEKWYLWFSKKQCAMTGYCITRDGIKYTSATVTDNRNFCNFDDIHMVGVISDFSGVKSYNPNSSLQWEPSMSYNEHLGGRIKLNFPNDEIGKQDKCNKSSSLLLEDVE